MATGISLLIQDNIVNNKVYLYIDKWPLFQLCLPFRGPRYISQEQCFISIINDRSSLFMSLILVDVFTDQELQDLSHLKFYFTLLIDTPFLTAGDRFTLGFNKKNLLQCDAYTRKDNIQESNCNITYNSQLKEHPFSKTPVTHLLLQICITNPIESFFHTRIAETIL